MQAGLPGTGIGGLFYLASALFMPVHRLVFGGGHDGRSWRRVGKHTALALGILLMVYVTLWSADAVVRAHRAHLAAAAPPAEAAGSAAEVVAEPPPVLLRWFAALGAGGVLVLVLGSVELARVALFARRRPARAGAQPPARRPPRDGERDGDSELRDVA